MTATISTGEPSTLGTYRKIAALLTAENSPATRFFDEKIATQGEDAEVIQDESQMMLLIIMLGIGSEPQPKADTLFTLRPLVNWEPDYDKAVGFVVRASSESQARRLAAEQCGDEGDAVWLDPSQTSCEVIDKTGPAEILCRDYNAA